ncbi:hypothetical protein B0H13DRAFT_2331116 [Mycena leptocephala]|nr:hypothetical protein B0H13DRAFT_2331116 [Mycena leptocephala]
MTCAPTKYDSEPFWLSCARTSRPHLKNQDGVNAHSRRSSAAPPSVRQIRASSDAPDAYSTMSMPASLERSIRPPRQRARLAPRLGSRHRRTPPFLPRPHARHHAGANPSPKHATLAFLAAHVASSLPAHRDSSAVYYRHRLTPVPAVLPGTTFATSCVRSARDGRSP